MINNNDTRHYNELSFIGLNIKYAYLHPQG